MTEETLQAELELAQEGDIPAEIFIEHGGKRTSVCWLLESLLFVADTPVESSQLAKALGISRAQAESALKRLSMLYRQDGRGIRLQVREDRYQLVSMPEAAAVIEEFLSLDLSTRLSGPALEVLAIVAYRQPVTRIQIEAVRGVDCAGVLRSLLLRGLIEEIGRMDTVGRPILYGVSDLFMQHFGLTELAELPELKPVEEDALWAATELAEGGEENGEEQRSAESTAARSTAAGVDEESTTHETI